MCLSATREFDVIVFGASGYTGAYVAAAMCSKSEGLKIAVAGRSEMRVQEALAGRGLTGSLPTIVVADVKDDESLGKMAARARLVLNCVGPYRHFGESVVQACVKAGTDYMDLCGEPEFIERIQLKYSQAAKDSGSIVISACAFDSIPADLGFQLMRDRLAKEGGIPHSVESFLSIGTGADGYVLHYATFECAVLGFGSIGDLRAVRSASRKEGQRPALNRAGPKLRLQGGFFEDARKPEFTCQPFQGSDRSIIQRTQEMLTLQDSAYTSFQMGCYFAFPEGIVNKSKFAFFGSVVNYLAQREWGRSMLMSYPRLFTNGCFSHEGATKKQLEEASYEFAIYGKGYSSAKALETHPDKPDVEVKATVSGPDPGYIATSRMFTTLARVLLTQRDELSVRTGGVFTPATVFRGTKAVASLNADGCAVYAGFD